MSPVGVGFCLSFRRTRVSVYFYWAVGCGQRGVFLFGAMEFLEIIPMKRLFYILKHLSGVLNGLSRVRIRPSISM